MVKVKEVKHSDSEISSESPSHSNDDEEMEESMEDEMNMFDDEAEEGELDMDDYDEEGEGEFEEEFVEDGQESLEYDMEEMGEDELEALDQTEKDKRIKGLLSKLQKMDDAGAGQPVEQNSESSDESADIIPKDDDDESEVSVDSETKIDAANALLDDLEKKNKEENSDDDDFDTSKLKKFGQRGINNVEQINKRLHEVQQAFYNRLESKSLIKKKGHIPFTEHMSYTHKKPLELSEAAKALSINNEIKREVAFYNSARENVMKGMEILVQAKIPIERPDDFFAEMLKTDEQMKKVKQRIMKQQHKIETFEQKKQKEENRKFHKAIKDFTQKRRHEEKRDNIKAIDELKTDIRAGKELTDKDFNKIMMNTGSKSGLDPKKGEKTKSSQKIIDQVKKMPQQKKDDKGRIGKGRFNRDLTYPKDGDKKKGPEKRSSDNRKDKKDASRTANGFKPKAKPQKQNRPKARSGKNRRR